MFSENQELIGRLSELAGMLALITMLALTSCTKDTTPTRFPGDQLDVIEQMVPVPTQPTTPERQAFINQYEELSDLISIPTASRSSDERARIKQLTRELGKSTPLLPNLEQKIKASGGIPLLGQPVDDSSDSQYRQIISYEGKFYGCNHDAPCEPLSNPLDNETDFDTLEKTSGVMLRVFNHADGMAMGCEQFDEYPTYQQICYEAVTQPSTRPQPGFTGDIECDREPDDGPRSDYLNCRTYHITVNGHRWIYSDVTYDPVLQHYVGDTWSARYLLHPDGSRIIPKGYHWWLKSRETGDIWGCIGRECGPVI